MLEMVVLAQSHVQISHAERKVLGQRIDRRRRDGSAFHDTFLLGVNGFRTTETLREMVQDRSQTVILV